MILKSFNLQCDFDFQITTSKIILILILNHIYLCDLILKSSTYDDFAHLRAKIKGMKTGYLKGMKTGYLKGMKTGYLKGMKTGYLKGMKTGYLKGMETGYL